MRPAQHRQYADKRRRRRKIDEAERAGIKYGDREDRAEVVDDRRRGEEDAQFDGDAVPSMTISATAKAVSVDIGTPQPCIHGPGER